MHHLLSADQHRFLSRNRLVMRHRSVAPTDVSVDVLGNMSHSPALIELDIIDDHDAVLVCERGDSEPELIAKLFSEANRVLPVFAESRANDREAAMAKQAKEHRLWQILNNIVDLRPNESWPPNWVSTLDDFSRPGGFPNTVGCLAHKEILAAVAVLRHWVSLHRQLVNAASVEHADVPAEIVKIEASLPWLFSLAREAP